MWPSTTLESGAFLAMANDQGSFREDLEIIQLILELLLRSLKFLEKVGGL